MVSMIGNNRCTSHCYNISMPGIHSDRHNQHCSSSSCNISHRHIILYSFQRMECSQDFSLELCNTWCVWHHSITPIGVWHHSITPIPVTSQYHSNSSDITASLQFQPVSLSLHRSTPSLIMRPMLHNHHALLKQQQHHHQHHHLHNILLNCLIAILLFPCKRGQLLDLGEANQQLLHSSSRHSFSQKCDVSAWTFQSRSC